MTSLVPEETLQSLRKRFGGRFSGLPELDRIALVTASIEGTVNHSRLREVSTEHPSDISRALSGLVREGLLNSIGMGRGTVYFLPGSTLRSSDDVFPASPVLSAVTPEAASLDGGDLPPDSRELASEVPTFRDIKSLPDDLRDRLEKIAVRVTTQQRVSQLDMWPVVHGLCVDQNLGIKVLAALLRRNEEYMRSRILNPMLKQGALQLLHPTVPNHPEQAYRGNPKWSIMAMFGGPGSETGAAATDEEI